MQNEAKTIALQTEITHEDWYALVAAVNYDKNLALAARMFYLLNPHSTHPFDYYVPDKMDMDTMPDIVPEYKARAAAFIELVITQVDETWEEDGWLFAARLLGILNQSDFKTFAPAVAGGTWF